MRPRFSLRLLLIVFTLIAILFGGAAHFVYRLKDQIQRREAACEQLEKFGYFLWIDDDHPDKSVPRWIAEFARKWIDPRAFPPAMRVDLCNESLTLVNAKHRAALFQDLGAIYSLTIHVEEISPEIIDLLGPIQITKLEIDALKLDCLAAPRLHELTGLRHLYIVEPIDDDSAQALAKLPVLEELSIDMGNLTSNCVEGLKGFPKLRTLNLYGRISDPAPLAAIMRNDAIEVLDLRMCTPSEAALTALASAKNATQLWISWNREIGNLFLPISKMPQLQELFVSKLPAAQMQNIGSLATCSQLKDLYLDGEKLTADDFRALKPLTQLRKIVFEGELSNAIILEYLQGAPTGTVRMKISRFNDYFFELVDGKLERKWVSPFP
jgi:hypothetical protein